MVTVGTYVQSSNQKLNTKISTKADIFRVDHFLVQIIWTQYFLRKQGYYIHENTIYRDTQSTIKLNKNDRRLSSKRENHINVRYYFIIDRIMNQEASVEFCPTLDMIGDYFTKSLQGYQFCLFHNIILVIHEYDIPSYNTSGRALIEEQKINFSR